MRSAAASTNASVARTGSYIKGQRYTLLTRRENLSLDGRRALKKLLHANRRLNTAYVLKEQFGQLWDYRTERGARAFFERWKDSLKWQRLAPYRKFAELIECSLGWNCLLLSSTEQGQPWLGRGDQQQDPGAAAPSLWLS